MDRIKEYAQSMQEYCVQLRRDLHRWPELSGEESRTVRRICEELTAMGLPYEVVDGNVIAWSGQEGAGGLAIRADFDALPLTEAKESDYCSQVPGKMHACGHDAHTAILLGTAKLLAGHRELLPGPVYFCFQKGAEIGLGAPEIVAWLKEHTGVTNAIGLHVEPAFATGEMGLYDREACAGAMGWELTIHGRGGHGSQPAMAIDPIKPLCEILPRFSALPSNRTDPFSPLTVTPCLIQAGTSGNIIPETAFAKGTARFYSNEVGEAARQMMADIAADISRSYGAAAEFSVPGGLAAPVLNTPELAALGRKAAAACGLKLVRHTPMMASDNFSCFLQAFPGFYAFLGVGDPSRGITVPHHNPKFDLDEAALGLGVEFFLRSIRELIPTA